MSLPATRFALPHVGAAGDQGPHFAACADPQVRGVFRRRQLEQRPVRSHDVYGIQRRDFPTLSQAVAAPTNTRPAHDPCTRQCSLSSRQTPGAIPASLCQTAAAAVPAALQSATRPDRAGLETDPAPRNPQSLLRDAPRCPEGRQRLLRSLAQSQQRVT